MRTATLKLMTLMIVVIALLAGSVAVVATDAENSRYHLDLLPEDIRPVAYAQIRNEIVNRLAPDVFADLEHCLYCLDLLPEDIREVAQAQIHAANANHPYHFDMLPEDIRAVAHAQTLTETVNHVAAKMVSHFENCLDCFDRLPEDIREIAHAQIQNDIANRITAKMVVHTEGRYL